MPAQSPEQFIKSLKKSGLIVIRDGLYYFIPLSVMNENQFPAAFQQGFDGISPEFFEKDTSNGVLNEPGDSTIGQVYRKMDQVFGKFRVADGVQQAIWINAEETMGTSKVSKSAGTSAGGSNQVFTRYKGEKIVVDMSKGGKPSNR